ncbi:hypothetical protein ColLi_07419 [Colletotrichum liriopes]|uniref:Uncharacterized protein n=1 Tax=Colletotrichum liriopes TaxID=708192 RepID=A0AA37LUC6_9PEZI|nr:hypothetical protein ColLi_07419 [Colletotrichum liriopes]
MFAQRVDQRLQRDLTRTTHKKPHLLTLSTNSNNAPPLKSTQKNLLVHLPTPNPQRSPDFTASRRFVSRLHRTAAEIGSSMKCELACDPGKTSLTDAETMVSSPSLIWILLAQHRSAVRR